MVFEVKILGCNSASFAYGRHHTSQLVCYHNHLFMVDCGEGTQVQLQKFKYRIGKLSHIFISHLHGDHYLGLVGLISTMHLGGRRHPLHIFGPPILSEIITTCLKAADTRLDFPLLFTATNPDEGKKLLVDLEGMKIYSIPVKHRIPTTGFIFEEQIGQHRIQSDLLPKGLNSDIIMQLKKGEDVLDEQGQVWLQAAQYTLPPKKPRTYAYCADTIYLPELMDVVKGVDLLYHEATFEDALAKRAFETFHTTAGQAAQLAAAAQVEKLVIGHYSSRYKSTELLLQQAKAHFENTELAIEGQVYAIPYQEEAVIA